METYLCLTCRKYQPIIEATSSDGEIISMGSTSCHYMGKNNPAFWLLPVNKKGEPDVVECTGHEDVNEK